MPIEAIRRRRSIRRYEDKAVPDELLDQILETIRYAPSWANKQGWQVMVLKSPEMRNRVSSVLEGNPAQKAVTEAPILLVICMDPNASGVQNGKEYYMADAGILMGHVMLEAADLGLGTVFIGLFDEDKVREVLEIPNQWRVVAMTPIGYPAKMPKERPRKELEEVLHWEKW